MFKTLVDDLLVANVSYWSEHSKEALIPFHTDTSGIFALAGHSGSPYLPIDPMTIGEHIMLLRKKKGLSQNDLGKAIGTSGDIIGRYERDIMSPSIDVIMRLAEELEVSIDFLVGRSSLQLDKNTLERLEDCSTPQKLDR